MTIEEIFSLIANNGFPLILSVFLIYRLDYFFYEIVENQKKFSEDITREIRKIRSQMEDIKVDMAKKS